MQRREAELEVCYCSVYFVLLLLLYVLWLTLKQLVVVEYNVMICLPRAR